MKLLLVEQDQKIIKQLKALFTKNSYLVDISLDSEDALDVVKMFEYDLLIININITKLDGISLCKKIRHDGQQMPILLLTQKNNSTSKKIIGLDSGADDFIIQPYDEDILLAKIRALLRRGSGILPPILEWRNLKLNPVTHEVIFKNNNLNLTPKEYSLLELFLRNSRRIFSHSTMIDLLWSYEDYPNETTIRSHVKSLRKKLKKAGVPDDFIETVYGVGYRLKNSEENNLSSGDNEKKVNDINESNNDENIINLDNLEPDLLEILQQSQGLLNARVSILENILKNLQNNKFNEDLRKKAILESHKLVSSLGTFGFDKASNVARELETTFVSKEDIKTEEISKISNKVEVLRKVLSRCPVKPLKEALNNNEEQIFLVVTKEINLMEKLDIEALKWGIQTDIAVTLNDAIKFIEKIRPNLILFDLEVSDSVEENYSFFAEINQLKLSIPIFILTGKNNLLEKTRLKISSLGGKGFLNKSIFISDIIKNAINLLEQTIPKESKIMVVDDDPIALKFVKTHLEPWGLNIKILEKIDNFWQTLNDFSPYLLILDMEMPNMTGLDLCKLVRSDSRWSTLPIIFLTSHRDPAAINQAFAVGADDFVNKPIKGSELVIRVINRIERIKLLKKSMEVDTLTGLIHRNRFIERLMSFFSIAERYDHNLCIVVIDIKNLKEIREKYNMMIVDKFSMALTKYLKNKLRHEDMITSWQDGVFVVSMYPSKKEDIEPRLEKLFKFLKYYDFSSFDEDNLKLEAQYSYGVAQFPEDGRDIQSLYNVAKTNLN